MINNDKIRKQLETRCADDTKNWMFNVLIEFRDRLTHNAPFAHLGNYFEHQGKEHIALTTLEARTIQSDTTRPVVSKLDEFIGELNNEFNKGA